MTRYDYSFEIGIFADNNVGIKTLAQKYLTTFFRNSSKLTIGVDFYLKSVNTNVGLIKLKLKILRINEKRFEFLWRQYLIGCNGLIVMYDITNAKSLNRISEFNDKVKKKLDCNIPVLLVGNKWDLGKNREVSKEQIEKLKTEYNISSSMEVSVKTGENVEEMFLKITDMIFEKLYKKS